MASSPKSPDVSDSDSQSEGESKGITKQADSPIADKRAKAVKKVISDDSGSESEDAKPPPPKKKKSKGAFIDEEAEESEDANSSDEDEDDDEDDKEDNYEADGFVVDDEEEEEDRERKRRRHHSSPERRLKRLKRKKSDSDDDLDEEDYDLIKENLGIEDDDEGAVSAERERKRREKEEREKEARRQAVVASSKKDLEKGLFGDEDDEDGEEEDKEPRKSTSSRPDDDQEREDYDSDEMDGFIVDDDDEGDGEHRPRAPRPKPRRHAFVGGPSLEELDEAEELFGGAALEIFQAARQGARDDEEDDEDSARAKKKKESIVSIRAVYEPSILAENLCTEEDELVRQRDIPERYQRRLPGRSVPDPEERAEEAEWIFDQLQFERRMDRGTTVAAIESVLKFYQEEYLEPPFVIHYRQEYYQPAGLRASQLWDILDYDERWDSLVTRKKSVEALLEARQRARRGEENDENGPEDDFTQSQYPTTRVEDAYRVMMSTNMHEDELRDLRDYLLLGQEEGGQGEGQPADRRRPLKKDFVKICRRAGLQKFCAQFCLSATQVGQCLLENTRIVVPKTPDSIPEDLALSYVSSEYFTTEQEVLKGARQLMAWEIASEPQIRAILRRVYRQSTTLSTKPTSKGRNEIDNFHYAHGLQYLVRKNVLHFLQSPSSAYLHMVKAAREKLIVMTINPPSEHVFLDLLEPIFLDPGASNGDWEEQRRLVLKDAIRLHLVPSFEREIKTEMLKKSKESVAKACGEAFAQMLREAPYRVPDYKHTFGGAADKDVNAMGICVAADNREVSYAVLLNPDGDVVDYKALPSMRSREINLKLKEFIVDHEPKIIVVNTSSGMVCRRMFNIVSQVLDGIFPDERFAGDRPARIGPSRPHVTSLDDECARIFSTSPRGVLEFPDYNENLRLAISLARYVQNPLSELAALWGLAVVDDSAREILYLHLHELQDEVGYQMLLKEYENCLLEVVNMVGVDVNHAATHAHAAAQLQFVCGLGPRKAQALRQSIQRRGHVEARQDILTQNMVGKVCYKNCAAFLRIRERGSLKEVLLDPLDDTRIHPESYFIAVKVCGDASGNRDVDLYDPIKYQQVVEDILFDSSKTIVQMSKDDPDWERKDREPEDKLSELDLIAYANILEREYKQPKNLTLLLIKNELRFPYRDVRRRFSGPTAIELFYLLSNETEQSLQVGMTVPVKITAIDNEFVKIQLDSGLRGIIRKRNLTDSDKTDFHPEEVVGLGQTIDGRIIRVNTERYEVEVTAKASELHNPPAVWPEHDPCFDAAQAQEDYRERLERQYNGSMDEEGRSSNKWRRLKRQIVHPAFQNFATCKACEKYLVDKPVGEAVFRPSSTGTDHLTLSWKIGEGRYVHIDVMEEEKSPEDRIGKKLRIKDTVYEDLDEVLARHIAPMNDFIEDFVNHAKFKSMSHEETSEYLLSERAKEPKRIPYCLQFADISGFVYISFVPGSKTVRHEKVRLTPNGFVWYRAGQALNHGKPFKTVDQLLGYFKKHCNDPPPQRKPAEPSRRPEGDNRYDRYDHRDSQRGGYGAGNLGAGGRAPQPPAPGGAGAGSWRGSYYDRQQGHSYDRPQGGSGGGGRDWERDREGRDRGFGRDSGYHREGYEDNANWRGGQAQQYGGNNTGGRYDNSSGSHHYDRDRRYDSYRGSR